MCWGGPTHERPTNLAEIVPQIAEALRKDAIVGTRRPELRFAFCFYNSGEGLRDER